MNTSKTDVSADIVKIDEKDIERVAMIAAGTLNNSILSLSGEIQNRLIYGDAKKEDKDKTIGYLASRIHGMAEDFATAARVYDAMIHAKTRENLTIVR